MNGQLMWCGWACVYCQVKGKNTKSQAIYGLTEKIIKCFINKFIHVFNPMSMHHIALCFVHLYYIIIHTLRFHYWFGF